MNLRALLPYVLLAFGVGFLVANLLGLVPLGHCNDTARALGLSQKGHLGVGADADVTIYNQNPDGELMFRYPRYVIKGGEVLEVEHVFAAGGEPFVGQVAAVEADLPLDDALDPDRPLRSDLALHPGAGAGGPPRHLLVHQARARAQAGGGGAPPAGPAAGLGPDDLTVAT